MSNINNLKPKKDNPIDLRLMSTELSNLTSADYWLDQDGETLAYIGMNVTVIDALDANCGVYYLKAFPSTDLANWTRTGDDAIANSDAFDNFISKTEVSAEIKEAIEGVTEGTPGSIPGFSEEAGKFVEFETTSTINSNPEERSNLKIPTEKAAGDYTDNHKPAIITQGSNELDVTASQLTFWLEV